MLLSIMIREKSGFKIREFGGIYSYSKYIKT